MAEPSSAQGVGSGIQPGRQSRGQQGLNVESQFTALLKPHTDFPPDPFFNRPISPGEI